MDDKTTFRKRKEKAKFQRLKEHWQKLAKTKNRDCGSCQACCTTMAVGQLNKPHYKPCKHLCDQGCNIYPTRPGQCRDWSCDWRLGRLDSDRPDQCGYLVTLNPTSAGDVWQVFELWAGAAATPAAKALIAKLPHYPVAVFPPEGLTGELADGRKLILHDKPAQREQWHEHAEAWRISLTTI